LSVGDSIRNDGGARVDGQHNHNTSVQDRVDTVEEVRCNVGEVDSGSLNLEPGTGTLKEPIEESLVLSTSDVLSEIQKLREETSGKVFIHYQSSSMTKVNM
jgi:hypothetical protein